MLRIGQRAPDFSALTTMNSQISLRDYRGRWVVLYFFPKTFTAG